MNKFLIEFRGLKEGKYNYCFEINDDFFNRFEEAEIKKGTVLFNVEMLVSRDLITLNVLLDGEVLVQCDRCLDRFYYPVKSETVLYVEFGHENSDVSDVDNKITLSNKENEIVLDKHFYDYIHLSLPYKRTHPKGKSGKSKCNIEMIKKMEELSFGNQNKQTDSRWDQLKKLLN